MSQNKLIQQQLQNFLGSLKNQELDQLFKAFELKLIPYKIKYEEKSKGYKCQEATLSFQNISGAGFGREILEARGNAIKNFLENMIQQNLHIENIKESFKSLKEDNSNQNNNQKQSHTKNQSQNINKQEKKMQNINENEIQDNNDIIENDIDNLSTKKHNKSQKNPYKLNEKKDQEDDFTKKHQINLTNISNNLNKLDLSQFESLTQKIGNLSVIQNNNLTSIVEPNDQQEFLKMMQQNDYNQYLQQTDQKELISNNKTNETKNVLQENTQLQNIINNNNQKQQPINQNLLEKFQKVQVNINNSIEKVIQSHSNNKKYKNLLQESNKENQSINANNYNLINNQINKNNFNILNDTNINQNQDKNILKNKYNINNNISNQYESMISCQGKCQYQEDLKKEKQKVANLEKRLNLILEENQILKSLLNNGNNNLNQKKSIIINSARSTSQNGLNNLNSQRLQSSHRQTIIDKDKQQELKIQSQHTTSQLLKDIEKFQLQLKQDSSSYKKDNSEVQNRLRSFTSTQQQNQSQKRNNSQNNKTSKLYQGNLLDIKSEDDDLQLVNQLLNTNNKDGLNRSFNNSTTNKKPVPKLNLKILPNYHGKNKNPINSKLLNQYQKNHIYK